MPTGDQFDTCDCPESKKANIEGKFEAMFKEPTPFSAHDGFPIPVTMRPPTGEIGVIVGRFQNAHIHAGYKELFTFVQERHPRIFVFVGNTPVRGSKKDPLPFQARRAMIETEYPLFEVFKMDDVFDVDKWSKILDRQIDLMAGPGQKVTLYGSRDCFKYTGKHQVEDVPCKTKISSTELRRAIGTRWQNDRKWREGVIWLSQNQFDKVHTTVDVAVVDFKKNKVLLGRKPTESKWRFPGGFADKCSPSFEMDALRELKEETQLNGTNLEYIGSTLIDDPRYRSQDDKIKTLFYAVTAWTGTAKADDDLADVQWFDLDTVTENDIVPTHHVLLTMLMNWKDKLLALAAQLKK